MRGFAVVVCIMCTIFLSGLAQGVGTIGEGFHEHALAVVGDETFVVARGRNVEIWSLSDLTGPARTLRGTTGIVWSLACSPGGARPLLAAGDDNGRITIWDLETGTLVHTLQGHRFGVWALCFSPDGRLLASGSHDSTVRLWEVESGVEVGVFEGHKSWVRCVAFSPDGHVLATSSCDGTVRLWGVDTLRPLCAPIKAGADGIYSLSFSPDGTYLAWGNYEGQIKLYRTGTWEEVRIFGPGAHRAIYAIAFSPDGRTLAAGGANRRVQLWEVGDGTLVGEFEGHTHQVWGVGFLGKDRLVSTSKDSTVRLWELGNTWEGTG